MKEVYDLYDKCLNCMNGDDTFTPKAIIEEAVDVIADIPELDAIWEKCVFHINNWNEQSIEEQCDQDEEIVEELSGYLEEYIG